MRIIDCNVKITESDELFTSVILESTELEVGSRSSVLKKLIISEIQHILCNLKLVTLINEKILKEILSFDDQYLLSDEFGESVIEIKGNTHYAYELFSGLPLNNEAFDGDKVIIIPIPDNIYSKIIIKPFGKDLISGYIETEKFYLEWLDVVVALSIESI